MMFEKIIQLYPTARPMVDFIVRDNSDGKGPYIAHWDVAVLGPKPTKAALAAVAVVEKPPPSKDEMIDKMLATHGLTVDDLAARLAKRKP